MSTIGLGRLGSTSPDPGASSHDQHALLDLVDGEESDARGRSHPDGKGSAAADLMRRLGVSPERRIKVTPEDDARVLRRIDMVVLPLMLAVYFLQGLDKATIAYASIFGLIEDTGLKGNQFSWLSSIVYVAQLIAQFPLAWLLVKLPIGKFTSCMVTLWGLTLTFMAAAHTFRSLLFARFWLGAFEASIAPSFVAITQMFWRRREQPLRMSYWYAMNGFTGVTIFVVFGIITVCFSTVLFSLMPDSPAEAKFLDKHDKLIAIERLRMNQTGVMSRQWRWDHFWETIQDLKTWLWFALIFSISVPSGGVGSFGPLLIKSFGFDSFQAILFNAPFGIVQTISTIGGSYVATKYHKKGPVIAFLALFPILGCMVMLSTPHTPEGRNTLLSGYYMISVFPGISQSLGNIVGPLLYKPSEAPEYHRGLYWNLLLYCSIVGLVIVTSMYLSYLNRDHSRRRVLAGKDAVITDYSLYSPEEADRLRRARATDGQQVENARDGTVGDHAFDDLTDLMNDEFVFVF
ncbi:major facilitator superfamily domain-containing protein [Fusarium acuminatum]|uniref:Major facilitator superfamily domain-containing protein n=1 Tax=Fusarium acuminatum TaxID=5515 RepID=A0ABZ2XAT2_9HYPO